MRIIVDAPKMIGNIWNQPGVLPRGVWQTRSPQLQAFFGNTLCRQGYDFFKLRVQERLSAHDAHHIGPAFQRIQGLRYLIQVHGVAVLHGNMAEVASAIDAVFFANAGNIYLHDPTIVNVIHM